MNVVHLHAVTHSYASGVPVLSDVCFDVSAGERVAILGESGAGKSTLLRCINGLITPAAGDVVVLSQVMRQLRNPERAQLRTRIGMIFQQFNVHERLNAFDNVLVGRLGYAHPLLSNFKLFSAADVALARDSIRQVGLEEFVYTRVRNLSGGQKQRVGIARALAQQPEILLGDEPTANLDMRTAREILALLKRINEERSTTLILAMHDVELAREFCERIVGIREGHIVFDGSSGELDRSLLEHIFY